MRRATSSINGAAYPQTSPITTTSGHRLLLRYLDAGLQHHSVGLLGLRQTIVNDDGNALANPRRMVAESLAPGQGTRRRRRHPGHDRSDQQVRPL